jgi:hypothetical protein
VTLVPDDELGARDWFPTPTGLNPDDVLVLGDHDAKALALWHAEVAGDVPAHPFWPAIIRRMSLETRLELISDPELNAMWQERERRRVKGGLVDPDGRLLQSPVEYFTDNYGHIQPEVGLPQPFLLWPEQRDVLGLMQEHLRLIVLKARQLGLTWLALHHLFHALGFDPEVPLAKILALSKTQIDASKLLTRARRINELLPRYLRLDEPDATKRSNTKFSIVDRGEMESLPGSPEAARSMTASHVLWDEAAFTRHGAAAAMWTALLPTIGDRGRVFVISTGNGPAEAPGDGQTFARLWRQARGGDEETGLTPIFLPDSVAPGRTETWRRRARKKFLTEEDFRKEHPESEDDAFAVVGGLRVYLPAGVNAAEKLGRECDKALADGSLPWPEALFGGADFGEATHMLVLWPLEGGGWYVAAEVAPQMPQEVGESTREFCQELEEIRAYADLNPDAPDEGAGLQVETIRYDAAGAQSIRTFVTTVQRDPDLVKLFKTKRKMGKDQVRTVPVAFGKFKKNTMDHLRMLFRRSARTILTRDQQLELGDEEYCDGVGILAISQKCTVLLRQLRGLERVSEEDDRIRKKDDHGPDALIAGDAPLAVREQDR